MAYRVENGQLRDGIECKLVVAVPGPDVHIRRALPTCRHRDGDRVRECRVKHGERILHARRWAEAIANPTQPVLVLRPERDADSLSCDGKDVTRRDGNGTGNGRCGRLEIRRPDTGECLGNRTDAHSTRHRPGGAVDRRVEEITLQIAVAECEPDGRRAHVARERSRPRAVDGGARPGAAYMLVDRSGKTCVGAGNGQRAVIVAAKLTLSASKSSANVQSPATSEGGPGPGPVAAL